MQYKEVITMFRLEKKGLEVLKSTFVTFGTFSLLDWFYIRLRVFFGLNFFWFFWGVSGFLFKTQKT